MATSTAMRLTRRRWAGSSPASRPMRRIRFRSGCGTACSGSTLMARAHERRWRTVRICRVDGCGRPHYGLSWCRRHWERMHKYGRLHLVHASPGMSAADILAWKSERVGACLVWTGGCSDDGYGQTTVNGVRWQTHRLAYTVHHGPIPDGEIVRHSCDNPPCMEPSHLLSGTHADNGNDK